MTDTDKKEDGNKLDFITLQKRVMSDLHRHPRVSVDQESVDLARQVAARTANNPNSQGQQSRSTVEKSEDGPTVKVNGHPQQSGSTVQQLSPTVNLDSQKDGSETPVKSLIPTNHPLKNLLTCTSKKAVFHYLQEHGDHVTKNGIISEFTGFPLGTVRDALRAFEAAGIIEKERWREGPSRGMKITLLADLTVDLNTQPQQSRSTGKSPHIEVKREIKEIFLSKTDVPQKTQNSVTSKLRSLSTEQIRDIYPSLASIGFTAIQVDQIVSSLESINKTPDSLFVALEHADYAVENDLLFRKGGVKITAPPEQLAYIVGGLRKTGYWGAPKGYIPPEVQAKRDAAERDRMLASSTKEAEDAAFELWRSMLTAEEKNNYRSHREKLQGAKKGKPEEYLGPEEHWLKPFWKEAKGALPE